MIKGVEILGDIQFYIVDADVIETDKFCDEEILSSGVRNSGDSIYECRYEVLWQHILQYDKYSGEH
jgi:hypothetical protein